jgi:hypothetical protein
MKQVLILERCTSGLNRVNENADTRNKYVLEGTFTEFDRVNRNKRVYKADTFMPHLNEMVGRINDFGAVYGEFDHPETFDIQLKNTSHRITSAVYKANENRVHGEIQLLTTYWGKEARAMVDDNCPLFVSSRAAGVVESNGHTRLNRLFTYDIVADPGFSSARMNAKNVNESYGITDDPNIMLFDLAELNEAHALAVTNSNDAVTRAQMAEYQDYLLSQITSIREQMGAMVKQGADADQVLKMSELYENTQTQLRKMDEYLEYLREQNSVTGYTAESSIVEKVAALESENNELKSINEKNKAAFEYLFSKLDSVISYVENVAENVQVAQQFSEYIAAHVHTGHKYAEHIASTLRTSIDQVQGISEKLDNSIGYTEDLAGKTKVLIAFNEYVAEHLSGSIEYTDHIMEHVTGAIEYVEHLKEHTEDNINYMAYLAEKLDRTVIHNESLTERVNLLTEHSALGTTLNEAVISIESPVSALGLNAESAEEDEDEEGGTEDAQVTGDSVDAGQPEAQVSGVSGADDTVNTVPDNSEAGVEAQAVADEEVGADGAQPDGVAAQGAQEGEAPAQGEGDTAQPAAQDGEPTTEVEGAPAQGDADEAQADVAALDAQAAPAQPAQGASQTVVEVGDDSISIKRDGRETIIKLSPSQAQAPAQDDTITEKLRNVIDSAKKRKAAENDVPAFFNFLSEAQVADYKALNTEQQEKVQNAINESPFYTTDEVLRRISKALSAPEPTLTEKLLAAIPEDVKPAWDALSENQQAHVLAGARFYENSLRESHGIESFWRTRPLEADQRKVVVLSNNPFDNSLSDDYVADFTKRFKNL